jgi:hypothetical protein
MEEDKKNNEFKSCCFKFDKAFVKYLTQVFISYLILGLSIYKLITIDGNSEDKSIYISLITLILGIYTPAVKLQKKEQQNNLRSGSLSPE